MYVWEMEKVEQMSEDAQRDFYNRLIEKYKKELNELKLKKSERNLSAINSCAWRTGLIASAVLLFAGVAAAVLGEGALKIAGEIGSALSIGLFGGSMVGSIVVDDDGPKDIKINFEAAKEAKRQIKELKAKIKEIEQKPVMSAR